MCNEFRRHQSLQALSAEFDARNLPMFAWQDGRIPNDAEGKDSIRIGEVAAVFRLADDALTASMTPWAWKSPQGKPVFNFRSEGRDFGHSDRVLILTDGFYEYTAPTAPKVKLKDRHLFTMTGQPWFWIAGLVKENAFTMLTTAPGADIAPYHDRQVVVFEPRAGLDWLTLARPEAELLRPAPAGTLQVQTLRKDGVDLVANGSQETPYQPSII